jgi:hypothetical protein
VARARARSASGGRSGPLQQVLNYAERMTELGKPFELDRFDAGHGALIVAERIRQMEVLLRFAAGHVPGGVEPEA